MGSNAARSVPIICWHRPAQRHLVPDLRAAAALPHEKKVGLDFNLAPRSVIDCLCSQLRECVSVWPCEIVDTHHKEGKCEIAFILHVRVTAGGAERLGDRQ